VLLDTGALSDAQLREAASLLGDLNESWFGYRSGDPVRPSSGEPRAGFDPAQATLGQRVAAKASELGCSAGKLHQKRGELLRRGVPALVDGRAARSATGRGVDTRVRDAILAEAKELADASDVAIDVCTRSILAFRLTPFSTQGVDLALLLSDLRSPTPVDGRWPVDVSYPSCGVPEDLAASGMRLPSSAATQETTAVSGRESPEAEREQGLREVGSRVSRRGVDVDWFVGGPVRHARTAHSADPATDAP
jgi:hypothetical protein